MRSFEERINALVARARQKEATRLKSKEQTIDEVMEMCLDAMEKVDDDHEEQVIVFIPTILIKNVPEWRTPAEMGRLLEERMQSKVSVDPYDMDGNRAWGFRLIVK